MQPNLSLFVVGDFPIPVCDVVCKKVLLDELSSDISHVRKI